MQKKQVKLDTIINIHPWDIIKLLQIICHFRSLAYSFTTPGENISSRAILMPNEESLNWQYKGYKDRIAFATAFMKYQVRNLEEEILYCKNKK